MGCIQLTQSDLPEEIIDTSTLSLSLDNQGIATLQYALLKKDTKPITTFNVVMELNNVTFKGFLESSSPKELEGTDFFEHIIVARGMICNGGGFGGSPRVR
jgi:hypothetical protein